MKRAAENTRDSAGRVLILVENLSVPFDRRVWREATALSEKGYRVRVICPRGKQYDQKRHEVIDNISIYRCKIHKPGLTHKILSVLERMTFAAADVVMSTNESYKQVAVSRGGQDDENVVVVRNGPDLRRVRLVKANPDLKRGKKHLVFYIGTMGAQDGVDFLLRSVQHLVHNRGRTDFHVLVMGGGTELEKVKRYAAELNIDEVVEFTGRVADEKVIEALSTADVCVCPDPHTQLNDISTMNKTLEYMAVAKPVVAYDLKETRVSAGDAALYAAANDEKDFADKIAQLLDSEELRLQLGRIGKERIEQGLSWEHSKKKLYKAYAMALGSLNGD